MIYHITKLRTEGCHSIDEFYRFYIIQNNINIVNIHEYFSITKELFLLLIEESIIYSSYFYYNTEDDSSQYQFASTQPTIKIKPTRYQSVTCDDISYIFARFYSPSNSANDFVYPSYGDKSVICITGMWNK